MLISMMILLFITSIIVTLSIIISKKSFKDMEKASPIECGMNMINSPRIPFSIQFFLIAILFMIFDVEIALIIPLPLINMIKINMITLASITFLMILLLGLLYEWLNGALEWSK
uniref:NADH-ubiquinone oxidoreductase chain 3 n=1 Tax=Tanystylum sp. JZ-2022 TaxID=2992008 RepID=A0A9E7V8D0_9CHEL|nr:NADH dehydrogenase subunit 3 [Tanystylum sp. JZ-2022]